MAKTEKPAAEAGELQSYELAFHVLPTVAEGEVAAVFQSLKDKITKLGGEITTEEAPARFDLAYEIIKYLEGRNRKFTSAYFGWVRFNLESAKVDSLKEGIDGVNELLRYLLIKLTKVEVENPFYFHEALEKDRVTNIEIDDEVETDDSEDSEEVSSEDTKEEAEEDGEESKDTV